MPTETVYGLAADADNDTAVGQIFRAKGRPPDHPLIVHVADASVVAHFAADVPAFAQQLMQAFWPGPLTLILPRRPGIAAAAAGGHDTIGLRCPAHPVALSLLKALSRVDCGSQAQCQTETGAAAAKQLESDPHCFGLAAPSANQFGRVSPTTAAHVQGEFGDDLLILDGGACQVGIESTIIDCTRGQPVLLRPGAITPAQIEHVCGRRVLKKDELSDQADQTPKASGTLDSHYAPKARVRLMGAAELKTALTLLGTAATAGAAKHSIGLCCRFQPVSMPGHVLYRAMPTDAAGAAQQLFAMLRSMDEHGVKLIWVETPPDDPAWDGVRDRLQRAAH